MPTVTVDPKLPFQSFDFSDGECFVARSDNENTDFGFGQGSPADFEAPPTGPVDPSQAENVPGVAQSLGTTPEPSVGFGTQPGSTDFDYGVDAASRTTRRGTPVAGRLSQRATRLHMSTATGGGTKFSRTDPGDLVHAVTQIPGTSTGAAAQLDTSPGVMAQRETLLTQAFTGQYKPNTGAAAPVAVSTDAPKHSHLVYFGLGLIAVALLMGK